MIAQHPAEQIAGCFIEMASATFGEPLVLLFVARAAFGEPLTAFCVAGAAFGQAGIQTRCQNEHVLCLLWMAVCNVNRNIGIQRYARFPWQVQDKSRRR